MKNNVVVVAPGAGNLRRVLRGLPEGPFSWAYLGQPIDKFREARRCFQGKGTWLDVTDRVQQTANALREPYLAYLFSIGRQLNTLRWWITSLSYRNIHTCKTFHQACYLKVALDLSTSWANRGPLVLLVADYAVRRAVQENLAGYDGISVEAAGRRRLGTLQPIHDISRILFRRVFFLTREAARIIQSRWARVPRHVPTTPTTVIISSVHSRNLPLGGDFHKYAFGDTVTRLAELGHSVAVAPLVLRDVSYKQALLRLRDSSIPLMVPHRFLTIRDLLRAAISTLTRPPVLNPIPRLERMDISHLVKEELRMHWVSNGAADAMLMAALVRRWSALGCAIARIIYIYENQPWERALCWETRRSFRGTALVGYQHAAVPRLVLKFYLAPGEESVAPLPDRVVTNGRHTATLLSTDGYPCDRVRVGGAFQMQNFLSLRSRASEPTASADGPLVLIAPSIGLDEATELVSLAANLFSEDEGMRVAVKCHPLMPFSKISQLLDAPLPRHVLISEDPITGLMQSSSLMVYTGSTVCVQALALGVPLIHLRSQFDLDLDPLESVPDVRLEAMGLEELRQKVRWLLEHREEYIAQHRERWDLLVEEFYSPVTEETYRVFID